MAENSDIEWTTHTFNPWWGCTKISAGCSLCYASTHANRFGDWWGPNAQRKFMGDAHWLMPIRWNKKAAKLGVRHRVFCASMSDVFERHADPDINDVMDRCRRRLWNLIDMTPPLDWLLLTERPENVNDMMPASWFGALPGNIWMGVTAEDQAMADARVPILASQIHAYQKFVSYEPALAPVDLTKWLWAIDWVICGGERAHNARPMDEAWARSMRDQCHDNDARFFYKQKMDANGKKVSMPRIDGKRYAEVPA